MLGILFVVFIVVPLAELALLLEVADRVGPWATLGLVIVTGVVGATLARWQGWRVLSRIRADLAEQRMPTEALLDGAMILVAGALLLTPGIMTDLIGFSLLLPPCRALYRRWLRSYFRQRVELHMSETHFSRAGSVGSRSVPPDDQVIDAYVVRSDEER